jgi:hypothetical protein
MNSTKIATSRFLAAAIFAMVVVLFASCADAADWYPAGSATVAGSYEYDDAGLRSLVVTATIENTGSSAISRSTYTITATTDARTYWKTVTSETRVLPGAKIKVTGVIEYLAGTETLKTDGLVIGDAFFE